MKSFEYSIHEAGRCSALFRFGRDVEAALLMVELFDGVQALLLDASSEHQQVWTQLLLLMLGCQERQDWLGLADTLQYEMVELLGAVQASR
ncbi:hypothetical protein [Pseudomonas gingeri]|uniref:Uncharacterized protein n=1 Tax=Pseudomonas gingeri TaxID=117681 RepID=A0A7Y7YFG5_9PSED|nr:hypothetical protein [Pseudomonas gingeri]NWA00912.1 hypothetical protein [Pseudomonas gingeri]NWA16044.1 hypothetical protein [Pseudomonas gingeri]NWA54234.1 hypothetical protein [Pseudomonas gingeri]NWA97689.1 hypothetical protein [Pseudomonas gingeri]NWB04495.1 hypothetical protein [Pseudomonas gingeri]